MSTRDLSRRRRGAVVVIALAAALVALGPPAQAASSKACEGGGYELVNASTGAVVASSRTGEVDAVVPAADLGDRFLVRGRYNRYEVRAADFAGRLGAVYGPDAAEEVRAHLPG